MDGRATIKFGAGVAACALAMLGGCGNSRTRLRLSSQPVSPTQFQWLAYPSSGVKFSVPQNWAVVKQRAPLVSVITSGSAVIAVWRFPRGGAPPQGTAAISQAASQLIAAVRKRDSTLQLIRVEPVTVQQHTAIELDALEHINGQLRRVRSTHVFVPGAEIVLDEYAPPSLFHSVDHTVFSPVKRSLQLESVTG